MAQQNVFDDETFFQGYRSIRGNAGNANDLIEKPALFSLLPDLKGKSLLDLGCGYGEHCVEFAAKGAERVIGIDISVKMLEVARERNSGPNIQYLNLPIEEISRIDQRFDLVVSSLTIHYIEDFAGLVRDLHSLLNPGGLFVFSQENPINTCFSGGPRWTRDDQGNVLHANLSNYSIDGERESQWFIQGVKRYHRTFSSIINTLVQGDFAVEKMLEPLPGQEIVAKYPEYGKDRHKPDFLLVRARRLSGK